MEKWLRDAGIIDGSKRYFFLLLKRMHMYTVEEELLLYMISLYNKLKVPLCYQTEDLYKADWRSATNSSRRNKKKKKMKNKRIFLNYWSLVYLKSFKTITTIHFYGLLLLRYKTKKK